MDNMKPLNPIQKTVVGVQFLFVAFGATVLVPLLVGLDPSTALFTAGIGTLIFHLVTKGKFHFSGKQFRFCGAYHKGDGIGMGCPVRCPAWWLWGPSMG